MQLLCPSNLGKSLAAVKLEYACPADTSAVLIDLVKFSESFLLPQAIILPSATADMPAAFPNVLNIVVECLFCINLGVVYVFVW